MASTHAPKDLALEEQRVTLSHLPRQVPVVGFAEGLLYARPKSKSPNSGSIRKLASDMGKVLDLHILGKERAQKTWHPINSQWSFESSHVTPLSFLFLGYERLWF